MKNKDRKVIRDMDGEETQFVYSEEDEFPIRIIQDDGILNVVYLTISGTKKLLDFLARVVK